MSAPTRGFFWSAAASLPTTTSVTVEVSDGKAVYNGRFEALPNQRQLVGTNGTIIVAVDKKAAGQRKVAIKLFADKTLRDKTAETLIAIKNPELFISFADQNDTGACIFDEVALQPHRPYAIALEMGEQSLLDVVATIADAGKPLHIDLVSHIMTKVVKGVSELHTLGLVHGDLKPSNVILVDNATGFPEAKLTDFDHCFKVDGGKTEELWERICPPEAAAQRLDRKPVTASTALDVWAVGCVMYEMIMGKELLLQLVPGAASMSSRELLKAVKKLEQDVVDKACTAVGTKTGGGNKGTNAVEMLRLMLKVAPGDRKHANELLDSDFIRGGDDDSDEEAIKETLENIKHNVVDIKGDVVQVKDSIERMKLNLTELMARTTQLSSLAAGLDQVKELVEKGHMLMTQLADNECPRTFVILPEVPVGHDDDGIKDKMKRWLNSFKGWLASPPTDETAEDILKGKIAEMLVDKYRLYLVCEVTGERQGQGYEIKEPRKFVTAVLPYMFVGFKLVSLVNAGLNLVKTLWPVPTIPDDAMKKAKEVIRLIDQPNTAAPWAPVAGALKKKDGRLEKQLGSALRVFRDFLDSSDPQREWAGLQRCYTKEGKVLWASARAVEQLQEGRMPGSISAAAPAAPAPAPIPAAGGHPSVSNDGSSGLGTSPHPTPVPSKITILPREKRSQLALTKVLNADEWSLLGAVKQQDADLVRRLLAQGHPPLNPNATDAHHEGFLHAAAGTGQVEVVRMLLDAGANIDAVDSKKSRTALQWAARKGHAEVVRLLLQQGADPHAKGPGGWPVRSPLLLAKFHRNTAAAKVLEEWLAQAHAAEGAAAAASR